MNIPEEDIASVREAFSEKTRGKVILTEAPTGYGKSTILPIFSLMEEAKRKRGNSVPKVLIMLPTSLGVNLHYKRMEPIVQQKGFSIGKASEMEITYNEKTNYVVATYGHCKKVMMQDLGDNDKKVASNYDTIFFDEYHSSDNVDVDIVPAIISMLLDMKIGTRIVFMSATATKLPAGIVADKEIVLGRKGERRYEVNYIPVNKKKPDTLFKNVKAAEKDITEAICKQIVHIYKKKLTRYLLVFLPTISFIDRVKRILEDRGLDVPIVKLSSKSPNSVKSSISDTPDEDEKIILSTNIAEVSITIPWITAVLDSGLANRVLFDPKFGEVISTGYISKDACIQRWGRVGRIAKNTKDQVYVMLSENQFNLLEQHEVRAIERSDISKLVTELISSIGSNNAKIIKFLKLLKIEDKFHDSIKRLIEYNILSRRGSDKTIDGVTYPGYEALNMELIRLISSIPMETVPSCIIVNGIRRFGMNAYPLIVLMSIIQKQQVLYRNATELTDMINDWNAITSHKDIGTIKLEYYMAKIIESISPEVEIDVLIMVSKIVRKTMFNIAYDNNLKFRREASVSIRNAKSVSVEKMVEVIERYYEKLQTMKFYPDIGVFSFKDLFANLEPLFEEIGITSCVVNVRKDRAFTKYKDISYNVIGDLNKGDKIIPVKIANVSGQNFIFSYVKISGKGMRRKFQKGMDIEIKADLAKFSEEAEEVEEL